MRDIPGYEGLYAATEDGRIFSYKSNKFLKLTKNNNNNYLYVHLYKDGTEKNCRVHRLIAATYLENPQNKPFVNHKDEDKSNNNVENLEFCDAKYNNNYGTITERAAKALSKKVICVETGIVYNSITEAAKTINYNYHIIDCCKGKRQTAGGYHWRYYDQKEEE